MKDYRTTYSLCNIVNLPESEHVDDAAGKDDKRTQPVGLVVLHILDAAGAKDHIEWDVEVEKADQEPNGDDVCSPEEEEGLEHVQQAIITN